VLDLADGVGDGGRGRERLLADPAASWNFGPGDVPEAERVRRERARELAAGIVAYSADANCRTVVFTLDGRLWVLRVGDVPSDATGDKNSAPFSASNSHIRWLTTRAPSPVPPFRRKSPIRTSLLGS
jgi:hypothetical protein